MKAFIVDKYSKDVPLRAGQLPAPIPGAHDVLIAVHAAGINPIDSMALLSRKIRRLASRSRATYSFLFMRADGSQLREITALVDAGALRPSLTASSTSPTRVAALDYLDIGHAKGKVVISTSEADNEPPGSG